MHTTRPLQTGLTLVELMTALSVATVSLMTAIGGFGSMLQNRRAEGIADELRADLQFIRSESVSRNVGLRFGFEQAGSGASCYVIHTGSTGACSCIAGEVPVCRNGAIAIKSIQLPAEATTRVESNSASLLFDPTRGTVTPTATITVRNADGRELHHVVNVLGRVWSCAAVGQWSGYRACPKPR